MNRDNFLRPDRGVGLHPIVKGPALAQSGGIMLLYTAKSLKGYQLHGRDGVIGHVQDFYFDDTHWTMRYLVADTGHWLSGRQVLISPYALLAVNAETREITVDLTRQQIEGSPALDNHKPVSRQFEETYHEYFGWPAYWYGSTNWGARPYLVRDRDKWSKTNVGLRCWDPSLRSTNAVDGYHIEAPDGEIGHVADFLIDGENWAVRYLVISTRNWWPGRKVLVAPRWATRISWDEQKVYLEISREMIKGAPEYTGGPVLDRDYETRLHGHYNREGYWVDELVADQHA
jgi:PRC-barrel domain